MQTKLVIAIGVLLVVVVLGAVLIATPTPLNGPETPFISENVRVSSPLPGAKVSKMFTASGEARGVWYFEASFPIFILDESGEKVGQGIAQAEGDWMTEDFVRFMAEVVVESYVGPATISFVKDNPSGLPEHDDSVSFPIIIQ